MSSSEALVVCVVGSDLPPPGTGHGRSALRSSPHVPCIFGFR